MFAYDNSTDDAIRFEDDFINGDLAGITPEFFVILVDGIML